MQKYGSVDTSARSELAAASGIIVESCTHILTVLSYCSQTWLIGKYSRHVNTALTHMQRCCRIEAYAQCVLCTLAYCITFGVGFWWVGGVVRHLFVHYRLGCQLVAYDNLSARIGVFVVC
jgi:hypothetical protein